MRVDPAASVVIPTVVSAPDTSVTGLYRCRHIDLLRVTSAACRCAAA